MLKYGERIDLRRKKEFQRQFGIKKTNYIIGRTILKLY